jgi:hypothetical protein
VSREVWKRSLFEALTIGLGLALVSFPAWTDAHWFEVHFTRRYCAVEDAPFVLAASAPWIALAAGAALLVVVRPRLVRRLREVRWRGRLGGAVRIGLALSAAFVLADLVLRHQRRAPPDSPFHYAPRESYDVLWGGRRVHYAMDAHGFRARAPDDDLDLSAPTVLFSGESVAFGIGLEYDETIAAQFTARTKLASANLAVGAHALDDSFLRLKEKLPLFRKPVAVVTFVLYDWLERSSGAERWHLALDPRDHAQLVMTEPTLPAFLRTSPLFAALRTIARYHDDQPIDETRAVIRAIDAYARGHGAASLFVATQAGERCVTGGEPRPWLEGRLMEGLGVDWIAVDFPLSDEIRGDLHPNAEGAALYAAKIEEALRGEGLPGIEPAPAPPPLARTGSRQLIKPGGASRRGPRR